MRSTKSWISAPTRNWPARMVGGDGHEPPRNAVVHFDGEDPREGRLVRYTLVTRATRTAA